MGTGLFGHFSLGITLKDGYFSGFGFTSLRVTDVCSFWHFHLQSSFGLISIVFKKEIEFRLTCVRSSDKSSQKSFFLAALAALYLTLVTH